MSDLSSVREVGSYVPEGGDVRGVHVEGSIVYVAAGSVGLLALDVSEPARPRVIGKFNTPRSARTVFIAGSRAYVGDTEWVRVYDVSNPANLRSVASYKTPSLARELWVVDDVAYLAAEQAGVLIFKLGGTP